MIKTGLRGEASVTYQGKIKLHGTNAGIHITRNGEIQVQSRNHNITVDNDNAGFAAWVASNIEYWVTTYLDDEDITIYGEWCGQGICKGAAINTIPTKSFAIFAIMKGTNIEPENETVFINDPVMIQRFLERNCNRNINVPSDVYVLPYFGVPFTVYFNDHTSLIKTVDQINITVAEVDKYDPWVKATFGVVGPGEGIVYHPTGETNNGFCYREEYSRLAFKAKGEKHSEVMQKKPVLPNPEIQANVKIFVDNFVTEPRLEHMITEHNLEQYLLSNMGTFLKAISQDIYNESKAEIEASPIEWKQAAKGIIFTARNWYIAKSKEL